MKGGRDGLKDERTELRDADEEVAAEEWGESRVRKHGLSVATLGKLPPHLLIHDVCVAAVSCHFGQQSSGAEVSSASMPSGLLFIPRKLVCLSTALRMSPFTFTQLITRVSLKTLSTDFWGLGGWSSS